MEGSSQPALANGLNLDNEFTRRLKRFIRIRFIYVLILGLAGISTELISQGLSSVVITDTLTALGTLSVNGVFWLVANRWQRFGRQLAIAIIALDMLVATFVIFTHGGIESRSVVLYTIPILAAGIMFGRLSSFYVAGLCALAYDVPLILQWQAILPRPGAIFLDLHKDGGYLLQSIVFYNAALAIVAFVADLSSRLVQESLSQVDKQYQSIDQAQQIARLGSWEWDIRHNVVTWSPHLYTIFGVDPNKFEASYQGYLKLVHPEDAKLTDAKIRQALADRRPFELDHRIIKPDGQIRHIHSQGQVLVDESGAAVKMLGTAQDVSEQATVQQQLQKRTIELERTREAILNVLQDLEKEKRVIEQERIKDEALVRSIGEGLLVIDAEGKILKVNPAACEMLGFSESELVGQWFPKAIPAVDAQNKPIPPLNRPIIQALSTGKTVNTTTNFVRKDKSVFPVSIAVSPFVIGGVPAGGVETFRDRTEEQKLEQAKEEFVSLASHQLRTPATGVKAFASMLADGYAGKLTPKQLEFLGKVMDSNERQLQIIDDMLNVARADAGRLILVKEDFDLSSMLDEIILEQQSTIQSRKQTLKVSKPPGKLTIHADPKRLRMVVENILSNASKYTPEGGSIAVSLTSDETAATVAIKDSGVGIGKKDLNTLFKKFGRIDNPLSAKVGGTGLGLYLAKEIIDLHRGKVAVESELGKGTAFTVTVPLKSEKPAEPGKPKLAVV